MCQKRVSAGHRLFGDDLDGFVGGWWWVLVDGDDERGLNLSPLLRFQPLRGKTNARQNKAETYSPAQTALPIINNDDPNNALKMKVGIVERENKSRLLAAPQSSPAVT